MNSHSKIGHVDFLVIGAGVAGLRAAVELAEQGEVLVITKESVGESNTHYAQGGIAVAADVDGDVQLHLEDTINAGDGLVDRRAAEVLVSEGPERVAELIEWGAQFDREHGELLRTREAAHSRNRILHANGDATGAEISRSLAAFARQHKRIHFAEWTMVTRLVAYDGRVAGAELLNREGLEYRVGARAVLVASGGAGQVYSDTTNPAVATGDGIALAAEAGAGLADMEFYQFHPTALSLPGAPRFLLSEALRGEGAYLINDLGERFMDRYHPKLELAPRDVVARAVTRESIGERIGETRLVYLDMRHVSTEKGINLAHRFPGITACLHQYGLSLATDLIPVRPAAHYLMGGIRTDVDGHTTMKGLYAAGEAACTGVHGANRLASNSLLEGLVFGARAARAILRDGLEAVAVEAHEAHRAKVESPGLETQITALRTAMWLYAGLLRQRDTLDAGLNAQAALTEYLATHRGNSRRYHEARSLARIADVILRSAIQREESRGAHFRNDFPKRDDERFGKHSLYNRSGNVEFGNLV